MGHRESRIFRPTNIGTPDFDGKCTQVGQNFNADFSDLFEKIRKISVDQRKDS